MTDSYLPPGLLTHLGNLPQLNTLKAPTVSPYGTLDTSHPWTPSDSFPNNYMALSQANGGGFTPIPLPPQRPLPADLTGLQLAQHGGGSINPPLPPSRPADLTPNTQMQANASPGMGNGFQNFFDRIMSDKAPIGHLIHSGIGVAQGIAPTIEKAGGGLRDILDGIFHPQA